MNRTLVFSVLALAVSLSAGLEPWARIGPPGLSISAMATVRGARNDVYLVTQGYPAMVYYTSNTGVTWTLRDTLEDRIHCIAVDPNSVLTLFCAGEHGTVFRSLNGARDWQVRGTMSLEARVRRLAVSPRSSTELWASAEVVVNDSAGLAVFRSTDAGASWNPEVLATGHTAGAAFVTLHPDDPEILYVGGHVNNIPRAFLTTDRGGNWTDVSAGLRGSCAFDLAFTLSTTSTVVCATDYGIHRSTTSGASWTVIEQAPAFSVDFGDTPRDFGYVGSDNLVYRSEDFGATWDVDTTEFYGTATRWLSVNQSRSLEVYAANGVGIFHTDDGGFEWSEITGELGHVTVPFVYFYEPDPEKMYACPPGRGIMMSEDRGLTWTMLEGFAGAGFTSGIAVNPRHPDTVIAVSRFDSRLHLTTDRGDSWVSFPIDDRFEAEGLLYHPTGPDTAYAWGGTRDSAAGRKKFTVYKTTSKGETWTELVSFGTSGICTGFEYVGDGETLYVWGSMDDAAALYRSTNRGGTWLPIKTGITGTEVRDFKRSKANGDVYFCATPSGVFRTLNRGSNWDRLGLDNVTAVLPDTADENAAWAGTDTQGFYYTTNAGSIWERDTLGLQARSVLFLRRHPAVSSAIFCSIEGSGLYGRGVIGIAEPGARNPLRLTRVRPTLVSQEAVVHLSPGADRHTTIDLYHADGRLAARIADLRPTPASYAWTRAPGTPNGAYLLVVRSEQEQQVYKVILTNR
ncbi:MAG: hypothetical protein JSU73_00620 [candidate division WOR-3 bacterium]|nr:MAG: hypothetical protein JSU73_00620 [candidate division WOR-3 bacterium]